MLEVIVLTILFKENNRLINRIVKELTLEEINILLNVDAVGINFKHNILSNKALQTLLDKENIIRAYEKANEIIRLSEENNIKIILSSDKEYPKRLFSFDDYPPVIYAKGNIGLLKVDTKIVSVIGSREISEYAKVSTKVITKALVDNNFTIVSGLAKGTDSIAHKICVENNGKTIAVVANGLGKIYPKDNEKLVKDILDNEGVIISEYSFNEEPLKYRFVKRNRIVSSISEAVIVIEAKTKSGTMRTVEYAIRQNKKIAYVYSNNDEIINTEAINIINNYKDSMALNNVYDCYKLIDTLGYISNNREYQIRDSIINIFNNASINNLMISEKIKNSIVSEFSTESKLYNELYRVLTKKGIDIRDFIDTIAYLVVKDNS